MHKLTVFLFVLFLSFITIDAFSKDNKPDQIQMVQSLIDEAYRLRYVDAAPVEMDFIEKKVIKAKEAQSKRKRKLFENLIEEIKADLEIVKQRYVVNELYNELFNLEQANIQAQQVLDDLKRQLK